MMKVAPMEDAIKREGTDAPDSGEKKDGRPRELSRKSMSSRKLMDGREKSRRSTRTSSSSGAAIDKEEEGKTSSDKKSQSSSSRNSSSSKPKKHMHRSRSMGDADEETKAKAIEYAKSKRSSESSSTRKEEREEKEKTDSKAKAKKEESQSTSGDEDAAKTSGTAAATTKRKKPMHRSRSMGDADEETKAKAIEYAKSKRSSESSRSKKEEGESGTSGSDKKSERSHDSKSKRPPKRSVSMDKSVDSESNSTDQNSTELKKSDHTRDTKSKNHGEGKDDNESDKDVAREGKKGKRHEKSHGKEEEEEETSKNHKKKRPEESKDDRTRRHDKSSSILQSSKRVMSNPELRGLAESNDKDDDGKQPHRRRSRDKLHETADQDEPKSGGMPKTKSDGKLADNAKRAMNRARSFDGDSGGGGGRGGKDRRARKRDSGGDQRRTSISPNRSSGGGGGEEEGSATTMKKRIPPRVKSMGSLMDIGGGGDDDARSKQRLRDRMDQMKAKSSHAKACLEEKRKIMEGCSDNLGNNHPTGTESSTTRGKSSHRRGTLLPPAAKTDESLPKGKSTHRRATLAINRKPLRRTASMSSINDTGRTDAAGEEDPKDLLASLRKSGGTKKKSATKRSGSMGLGVVESDDEKEEEEEEKAPGPKTRSVRRSRSMGLGAKSDDEEDEDPVADQKAKRQQPGRKRSGSMGLGVADSDEEKEQDKARGPKTRSMRRSRSMGLGAKSDDEEEDGDHREAGANQKWKRQQHQGRSSHKRTTMRRSKSMADDYSSNDEEPSYAAPKGRSSHKRPLMRRSKSADDDGGCSSDDDEEPVRPSSSRGTLETLRRSSREARSGKKKSLPRRTKSMDIMDISIDDTLPPDMMPRNNNNGRSNHRRMFSRNRAELANNQAGEDGDRPKRFSGGGGSNSKRSLHRRSIAIEEQPIGARERSAHRRSTNLNSSKSPARRQSVAVSPVRDNNNNNNNEEEPQKPAGPTSSMMMRQQSRRRMSGMMLGNFQLQQALKQKSAFGDMAALGKNKSEEFEEEEEVPKKKGNRPQIAEKAQSHRSMHGSRTVPLEAAEEKPALSKSSHQRSYDVSGLYPTLEDRKPPRRSSSGTGASALNPLSISKTFDTGSSEFSVSTSISTMLQRSVSIGDDNDNLKRASDHNKAKNTTTTIQSAFDFGGTTTIQSALDFAFGRPAENEEDQEEEKEEDEHKARVDSILRQRKEGRASSTTGGRLSNSSSINLRLSERQRQIRQSSVSRGLGTDTAAAAAAAMGNKNNPLANEMSFNKSFSDFVLPMTGKVEKKKRRPTSFVAKAQEAAAKAQDALNSFSGHKSSSLRSSTTAKPSDQERDITMLHFSSKHGKLGDLEDSDNSDEE